MRNLVVAEEIRRSEGCQTDFVIVYADHPNLPFPRVLKSLEWANFRHTLRMDSGQLETISYQELLGVAPGVVGSSDTKWRGWKPKYLRRSALLVTPPVKAD